jgi:2-C-methyl-D-erythritol 2,4-cyclodiphosphate synthase|tara:strand:- start:252 stop:728 length:477 start_codon:yes stop_codon:yes gene_type:complete
LTKSGIGFDVHPLAEGEKLILGGVAIPSEKGTVGHSDGDVLIHAIVDAILGAASLGDIGSFFPSEDEKWRNADSRQFLTHALEEAENAGFAITHIDSTIILEKPKLADIIPQMRYQIAYTLQVDESAVSIKATTTDKLGIIGKGEGVAAMAIATLNPA